MSEENAGKDNPQKKGRPKIAVVKLETTHRGELFTEPSEEQDKEQGKNFKLGEEIRKTLDGEPSSAPLKDTSDFLEGMGRVKTDDTDFTKDEEPKEGNGE